MTRQIRVALSGSGFKFPAHVGALAAVQDAGFEVVEVAGTSGGSIVASLLACGMPVADMKRLCLEHDWTDMLSLSLFAVFKGGYCSGANLLDWLLHATAGKTFADLTVELHVVASDVSSMGPFEFSREKTPSCPVALAARASASIPLVYTPVQYAGALLQDGGMVNNIPVDCLKIDGLPRLGVQLVSKTSPLAAGTHSIFEVVGRDVDLMLQANENAHVDLDAQHGAVFAFVETGFASGLDRNMALAVRQQLFDNGYRGATQALQGLHQEA